jgi:hypothetical protein
LAKSKTAADEPRQRALQLDGVLEVKRRDCTGDKDDVAPE